MIDPVVHSPDAGLINDDLRPARIADRHWSIFSMASLWVGMVVCVPTYMLAGGLIDQGMNWWQAVLTIMIGNVIVLVPMILNGHAGTKYGVPFPVLARASFGILGAHVPSLMRGLVACGWFGIQTWFGGYAIFQMLNALTSNALVMHHADYPWMVEKLVEGAPSLAVLPVAGISPWELACFLFFWAIQIVIITMGVDSIRWLEQLAAPFLIAIGLALLGWAYYAAGGFGPMLDMPSAFGVGGAKEGEFFSVFAPSLTAMVGFWATLSLNIPDFTRFAKSQKDQMIGQAIGLPTTMTLFAFISVAVTAATTVIFANPETGELAAAIADPTVLAGKIGGGWTVAISLVALAVATLSTNIAANVVSPANALINMAPRYIGFRLGGYITAGIGVAIFPWRLVADTGGYIFVWLVGYSALLGPVCGILIADYFLLRKMRLDLEGLYRRQGPYRYTFGFNFVAIGAFALSVLPNIPGFLHAAGVFGDGVIPVFFDTVYLYAWFVGFFMSILIYWPLMLVLKQGSFEPAESREPADPESNAPDGASNDITSQSAPKVTP